MKRALLALALCAVPWPATAQNAITQEGTVLSNSPMMFRGNNRARQGAPVRGAPKGQIVETGDAVVGGRCDYSAPTDTAGGYWRMCLDAKDGSLVLDGTTSPPPQSLSVVVNGTTYTFPGAVAIVGSDAVVGSNTALKSAPGAPGKRLTRLGFYGPGDGGIAPYNWSDANCSAADDGAQVQPSGTGCWVADLHNMVVTPQIWGARGDNTADDAPAIRAALMAAPAHSINVPAGTYRICSEINSTTPISVVGVGSKAGPGFIPTSGNTRFVLCNANQNGFFVSSDKASRFEGFWLTSAVPQSAGFAGIKLDGGPGAYIARASFEDVALGSAAYNGATTLYNGIATVQTNYSDFYKVYCQGWQNSCLNLTTHSGYEGSGGFIHHSYFFGNPDNTTQGAAIYSEVGYTFIHDNEILAGDHSVNFCIRNNPAGEIVIHHNTIENSRRSGVRIATCDGNNANMVQIKDNEFSNYAYATAMVAEILIAEYTSPWLKNVQISGNVLRSSLPSGAKYIWTQAGGNMLINNNLIEDLGGQNPWGIQITGATHNGALTAPIMTAHNLISNTTNKLQGNPTTGTQFVEPGNAFSVATLPAYPSFGSTVPVGDGISGSSPCAVGGAGAIAFFEGVAWKCF
jgi:hypothetical protein